ncbi:MAG: hypothetical protein ACREIT_03360 [Tepidisphaeraceae bacterium]
MVQWAISFIGLVGLTTCLVGCGPQARTYDVTVHNQTRGSILAWLTKDGPVFEKGWLAPEDIAWSTPRKVDTISGVVVEAGKTADTGPVSGKFDSGTTAVLRIYRNATTMDEILAVGRQSADRLDLPLSEGKNEITITDQGGKLSAVRGGGAKAREK